MGRNPMGTVHRLGPNRPGQAKFAVIGDCHGLGLIIKRNDRHHRAKNFLAGNIHIIAHIAQNGRPQEITILTCHAFRAHAACQQLSTFIFTLRHQAAHGAILGIIINRADLGRRIHRVPHRDAIGPVYQHIKERFHHISLHQQARPGNTALPGPAKNRGLRAQHGTFQIGIAKHDIGRFSAQFQHAGHNILRGLRSDNCPGARGANKHHLARRRVRGGRNPRRGAKAHQHLQYAIGQPGLFG